MLQSEILIIPRPFGYNVINAFCRRISDHHVSMKESGSKIFYSFTLQCNKQLKWIGRQGGLLAFPEKLSTSHIHAWGTETWQIFAWYCPQQSYQSEDLQKK